MTKSWLRMFAAVAINAKMAYLTASVVEANILRIQRGYIILGNIIRSNSPSTQVRGLIQLLRPKQWIKNGFVLAPLIFSGKFLLSSAITHALLAVFLFCVASSATYVMNDMHDVERDRQHPKKARTRPLAAGIVSMVTAAILLATLYAILAWAWFSTPKVMIIISSYMVLNLAYTFILKHQPVVDIFTIAIGFVLRIYAGAVALDVPVSTWMAITTLCLALYLAAIKRRQELSQNGKEGRKVLEKYSVSLVDRYAEMSATGALLFYSMFVMSSRPELIITIPLVLFGLFRYWFVVEALDGGESPTDALYSDWQLLFTVVLWATACGWALWPAQG
ncbi:4-hydroxybenzoate polyprenyltransferase [Herbaspirillum rubrisubalbicans]|uniref:decaprenyl-phosphate phosphoribosyltransferase n=1 Tax=Herbaspirillum rubrisubalbicans TaxID=80842 RepID=UPI00209E88DD|nr:decaprenyl-phosphate phosphoribosyltransferase [Herbaspirillum rubrisubalbicans]MCP1575842.1 4-hydroxybenzoate polyprenyltransferase [Herbaspirillum rubrisubalbicans]